MSRFKPNKRHLRELLIYFFNLKKSAAGAHRLLVETYGEAALSERSCCELFQKFKNGEFDIEDKECSRRPKVPNARRTCTCIRNINTLAISHRLKSLGMIKKQENWIPYELTPRNVECRFRTCEILLSRRSHNKVYFPRSTSMPKF